MLKLLKMDIEGFCSISQLSLSLDQRQTILIKAPNGSGKSTIFSALVWVIFGKNIKGVYEVNTWKKFRTKDYQGTMVSLFFQNNGSVYQIIRCQKYEGVLIDGTKGKDRLVIVKDAEILDIKGKNQQQAKISEIIGLSQSLFTNSIMFGQGINRLIRESNSDKKKLFEEVFDLNYLNVAKGLALNDLNKLLEDFNNVKLNQSRVSQELVTTKATYEDLKSQEESFKESILEEIKELRQDKRKFVDERVKIVSKLGEDPGPKVHDLSGKLDKLKKSYNKAKSISSVSIRDYISGIYTLMKDKSYDKVYESLEKLLKAFDTMESLELKMDNIRNSLQKVSEEKREYDKYRGILSDLDDDLESIRLQLKKLKSKTPNILSPKYTKRIKELKSQLAQLDEEYNSKKAIIDNYHWVIDDPLGNNGIKAYLFDSSLDMLNKELDRYAGILGFHIAFEIDLNSTRKEFVTLIEKDGYIMDYDELSGGEKQLVDISMAFAMNQALTLSRGINIAFLDELFESLSSDNIELVVQLMKEVYKDKTLFLITHHDNLPLSNARILEVEKHNGLSYYKGL